MKTIIAISILFITQLIYSQSISVSTGYGLLNMKEVNQSLQDSKIFFSTLGVSTTDLNEIKGGFYLEGNFKYQIGNFNIGVLGDYISSSGNFKSDNGGFFESIYDVSTTEFLALFEILIPIQNSVIQPIFQFAGGIGVASVEHFAEFNFYEDGPSEHSLGGNYFAGRVKGGLNFLIKNVNIDIGLGYRLANSGNIRGDFTYSDITVSNIPIRDKNGNAIEFDYSGFLITAGISIFL